jgi:hypothetical protein
MNTKTYLATCMAAMTAYLPAMWRQGVRKAAARAEESRDLETDADLAFEAFCTAYGKMQDERAMAAAQAVPGTPQIGKERGATCT